MATTPRPITETPNQTLLNRELSWLDLNKRVLDLAADPGEPLLERVKFCAIFSSNLDEFFMVRVAGLLDQVIARVNVRSPDGRTPQQALADVRERVLELTSAQSKLWRDELVPALAAEGIVMGTVEDLNESERGELEARFVRQIYPVLTPLAVGPGQPFPYISGLSLSLGVTVRDPDSGEERFARVKVPETLPRFVSIGDRGLMVALEGVISHHLSSVFPGMELTERAAFRVTRDGDTEISDDADDLLEAVESELRKRRFGAVVRLEVSSSISRAMVARLTERLAVRPDAVYPVHGLLDLREVMQLTDLDRPDLKYEPWVPQTQRRLAKPKDGDIFAEIASSDIVVQHPYDSFATSVEGFVRAAAKDPAVATLKTTVYRTSHDSALAPALIEAAENGKQSVCIVELKARFDERRNIEWARSLEQAGVHVVYGFPDLKIHAKTTLVIRREGDSLQRYVHIGTGNYHATTARIYEDVGLFTADPEIAADIADLFNFVTGFGRPSSFRKILVAPFNLRRELVERIRAVGTAAAAGEHAPDPDQGQQPRRPADHRGALQGVTGRRRDRPDHPRGLRLAARRRGAVGADPGPLDPRPVPRAQPALLLRGGRLEVVSTRQRGPDAAQSRSPDRDDRARRGAARARRDRNHLPTTPERQLPSLDAGPKRLLDPSAARSRRATESFPARRDARAGPGEAPRVARGLTFAARVARTSRSHACRSDRRRLEHGPAPCLEERLRGAPGEGTATARRPDRTDGIDSGRQARRDCRLRRGVRRDRAQARC